MAKINVLKFSFKKKIEKERKMMRKWMWLERNERKSHVPDFEVVESANLSSINPLLQA